MISGSKSSIYSQQNHFNEYICVIFFVRVIIVRSWVKFLLVIVRDIEPIDISGSGHGVTVFLTNPSQNECN